MAGRAFHSDSRTFANFQPGELAKLCGVAAPQWPLYILKELIDNALAAQEEQGRAHPTVTVKFTSSTMTVEDLGHGINDEVLAQLLDFDRFGGSNRHYKLPTRGAQGNALMTILGACSLWRVPLTITRPKLPQVRLTVHVDEVLQRVNVQVDEVGPPGRSAITVGWPAVLPLGRNGTEDADIMRLLAIMARVNPHATLVVDAESCPRYGGRMMTYTANAEAEQAWPGAHASGAARWFTHEELVDRLSADLRSRPQLTVEAWLAEFAGMPLASAQVAPWARDHITKEPIALKTLASTVKGREQLGQLARLLRDYLLQHSDPITASFVLVGKTALGSLLVGQGSDPDMPVEYATRSGTFSRGDAQVPFVVEVALRQLPKGSRLAADPLLCMNRTALYGNPTLRQARWREKVRGPWHDLNGDLAALVRAYEMDHGPQAANIVVHLTCPSPGYTTYGKQGFDTSWLAEPLSELLEEVTRPLRKQRAGEARRPSVNGASSTIRDTLFQVLPAILDRETENGKLPIMIRQLYYAVRKQWEHHHDKELEYPTFTEYVAQYETAKAGRLVCLRDPRGTLLEPHSGRELRLGTEAVERFEPRKWEGHTIIFVEKEGFAHLLKAYKLPQQFDAIVVGSKGYAVESLRTVLQKYQRLLRGVIKIICLHDADPAGYEIGWDLANNLPRFGERGQLNVIDAGLTIEDGRRMQLQDEPFDLVPSMRSKVLNMRRKVLTSLDGSARPLFGPDALDYFCPREYRDEDTYRRASKPTGRRIELNAMSPREFIEWLRGLLEYHDCKKVRPPESVVQEVLQDARRRAVENSVGAGLMRLLGDEIALEVHARIGVPTHDLDRVLSMKPEQHWEYIVSAAATRNVNIDAIVEDVLKARLKR